LQRRPTISVRAGFSPGAAPPQETCCARHIAARESRARKSPSSSHAAAGLFFLHPLHRTGRAAEVIASDIIEKFVAAHPFPAQVADRRPIGMLSLASARTAPRPIRRLFVRTERHFTARVASNISAKSFSRSPTAARHLKQMGAQGMIFWI